MNNFFKSLTTYQADLPQREEKNKKNPKVENTIHAPVGGKSKASVNHCSRDGWDGLMLWQKSVVLKTNYIHSVNLFLLTYYLSNIWLGMAIVKPEEW